MIAKQLKNIRWVPVAWIAFCMCLNENPISNKGAAIGNWEGEGDLTAVVEEDDTSLSHRVLRERRPISIGILWNDLPHTVLVLVLGTGLLCWEVGH